MPKRGLFCCIPACGQSFDTDVGLEVHQDSCSAYSEVDDELGDLPQLVQAEEDRRKRRRHEELESSVKDATPPLDPVMPDLETTPPTPSAVPAPPSPVLGRGKRVKRFTYKILEMLPQPPIPVAAPDMPATLDPTLPEALAREPFTWQSIRSSMNIFGLFRDYASRPTFTPDDTSSLEDLADASVQPHAPDGEVTVAPSSTRVPWFPFANLSIFLIISWLFTGSNKKSLAEADRLIDVLQTPGFSVDDLTGFSAKREATAFDEYLKEQSQGESAASDLLSEDGWKETVVPIEVPDGLLHRPGTSDPSVPIYPVPGLVYRSITSVIRNVWTSPAASHFHLTPFRQYWQRTPDAAERVHGELFASDAFAQVHEEVQNLPAKDGCTLERVVCALMFWSDATHLASFGSASLWPIYLFFGNESKYRRASMRTHSCHHIAYLPKLPDAFFDWYETLASGRKLSDELLTHLRSQLMHAIWALLLDEEFMDAYVNGIVIDCPDGKQRRVFPRLFTYSADYPEKVLLATIRNMGKCPCPRCAVAKEKIGDLGMERDDARRARDARTDNHAYQYDVRAAHSAVYERGKPIRGVDVEGALGAQSYVPTKVSMQSAFMCMILPDRLSAGTQNAFSVLQIPGIIAFNFFSMLVVDLMHEFELGVFKNVFIQLMRILNVVSDAALHTMNRRFRLIPVFGRGTIRRFANDVSQMKKLAARDWEDIMLCALPVLEGLFPDTFDPVVQDLVFSLCYWHALAKLRMHTDSTINLLRGATKTLGTTIRLWAKRGSTFPTKELPREAELRGKRRSKKARRSSKPASAPPAGPPPAAKAKTFNLLTYKLHALGDYVRTILWFGTTDSYSTQRGELEHRRPKAFYARTNKNRATIQISQLELRQRALRRMAGKVVPTLQRRTTLIKGRKRAHAVLDFDEQEPLPVTSPEMHHHISHAQRFPVNLPAWLRECKDDPLTVDFYGRLQDHLLERLLDPDCATDDCRYSTEERVRVFIQSDRIYLHKVLRINYTTYDVRRAQDSLNPRLGAHIMTPTRPWDNLDHPFSYARILGIAHVNVSLRSSTDTAFTAPASTQLKEVLWVRWFRHDSRRKSGFKSRRLPRLQLVEEDCAYAYGFLDPDDVIRGSHLIPAFAFGKREDGEWQYHYVNIFVDRDMFMRYTGLGVGHNYRTTLPEGELDGAEDGSELDRDEEDDAVAIVASADAPAGDHGHSDESDSDGSVDEDDEDGDGEQDGPDDIGLDLGPEDGEDAAAYDFDDGWVGYDDP
ncbi:unnamed protein product [Peniophora sp. CBMAI 1063]|nr:unnamed protein product [Peniophora sp. CBMAI 1063]